jgi:hypothetical protein
MDLLNQLKWQDESYDAYAPLPMVLETSRKGKSAGRGSSCDCISPGSVSDLRMCILTVISKVTIRKEEAGKIRLGGYLWQIRTITKASRAKARQPRSVDGGEVLGFQDTRVGHVFARGYSRDQVSRAVAVKRG